MKYFLLGFMLTVTLGGLLGQTTGERIFLHTDRDVYAPADEIKFKAYTDPGVSAVSKSSTLYLLLVNAAGKIVAEEDFNTAEKGSAGSMVIPDSMADGEYRLLAYTDQMAKGSPRDAFTKNLIIRKIKLPQLFFSLRLDAPFYVPGDNAELSVHICMQDRKPFSDGQFIYLATKNGVPYQNGLGRTDENGNASLLVRIPYTTDEGLIMIEVTTEFKGSTITSSILVPSAGMPFFSGFFPEGGTLIDGLDTDMAFRMQDFEGNPMPFTGLVLNRLGEPVDSIRSGSEGIGLFHLVPGLTDSLRVKIIHPAGITREIPLPAVQAGGVQLILKERTKESLKFLVRTNVPDASRQLVAVVEAPGGRFTRIPLVLRDTLSFRVPVDESRGGIIRVSLVSDNYTLAAQRQVFIRPRMPEIILTPVMGKGKKPEISSVSLMVKDPSGEPVSALLSVSVSDAMLNPEWNQEPDIRSWFLMGPEVQALSNILPSGLDGMDEKLLDHIMMAAVDTTADWMGLLTGKGQEESFAVQNYRQKLVKRQTQGPFEQLAAKYHLDRFLHQYFSVDNIDFYTYVRNNESGLQDMGMLPAKATQDDRIRQQLDNGVPVLSVLRMISPYTMNGNMIVFGKGANSMAYAKGALFVIDGSPKGYNADVLNSYSPYDIAGIKVTQKVSDILRYSADASAVIFITTRQALANSPGIEPRRAGTASPVVFWNPEVKTGGTEPVMLNLPKPKTKSDWRMVIRGVDSNGNYVEADFKRN